MVQAIVGANWGDEGKGKITDVLAEDSDVVVRFQGGANAGHTIINDYGKFALHLLPSGVFHSRIANIIGPGVALDIDKLLKEYDDLVARGVGDDALSYRLRPFRGGASGQGRVRLHQKRHRPVLRR
jgi:adenylosuccinate synthase